VARAANAQESPGWCGPGDGGGRGCVTAFSEWLRRYKVDDMDKSDRAKLLQLMEERLAVEEWRATLTDHWSEPRASSNNGESPGDI
jgi:hypothetical protein